MLRTWPRESWTDTFPFFPHLPTPLYIGNTVENWSRFCTSKTTNFFFNCILLSQVEKIICNLKPALKLRLRFITHISKMEPAVPPQALNSGSPAPQSTQVPASLPVTQWSQRRRGAEEQISLRKWLRPPKSEHRALCGWDRSMFRLVYCDSNTGSLDTL